MIKKTIILNFLLLSFNGFSQHFSDLNLFVKNKETAELYKTAINDLESATLREFLIIINDTTTTEYKLIKNNFDERSMNNDNNENYIYPKNFKLENLSIQFLNYSTNWGWESESNTDFTFTNDIMTSFVSIPLIKNVHKGNVIDNICFKIVIEKYRVTNEKTRKLISDKVKVVSINNIKL